MFSLPCHQNCPATYPGYENCQVLVVPCCRFPKLSGGPCPTEAVRLHTSWECFCSFLVFQGLYQSFEIFLWDSTGAVSVMEHFLVGLTRMNVSATLDKKLFISFFGLKLFEFAVGLFSTKSKPICKRAYRVVNLSLYSQNSQCVNEDARPCRSNKSIFPIWHSQRFLSYPF